MRSLLVACVALGVASAAFVSPAYSQFVPNGHRVFVPDRSRQVEFRRHDEWRERQAWREREEWRRREAFREHRWGW